LDLKRIQRDAIEALRRRLELGDAVLLVFFVAFARQYFWPVANNAAAWTLALTVAGFVWLWHLRTKEDAVRPPAIFWPVVGLPLLFFFLLRAAIPDMSWDVLDYRLINAERALTGWPMRPGDFFPTRFPFNPAPDMAAGISRHILGYRLGTALNLAALLWAGMVLERLLRTFIERAWLRSMSVLLLLLTEHLLFEVNNYMVDVLALPLMLEATRVALTDFADARAERRGLARIGFYLGASLAFKLTNLAYAVPLVALCAYRMWKGEWRFDTKAVAAGAVALLLPLAPYTVYIYWQTGNPVFPLYNGIFQSPYWPAPDPHTERWGPVVDDVRYKHLKVWEILLWPLLHPFRVEHTAGDVGPHWGRVSLAFAASLCCLLWRGSDARVRRVAFVAATGALLWSAASGMLRYAMYVETAGGLVALYLFAELWRASSAARVNSVRRARLARGAGAVILAALLLQSASSCVYAYRFEWSVRPTFFSDPAAHLTEARYFLRDRSLRRYLSAEERALFRDVEVWVQSGALTSGYQVLVRPSLPEWCVYMEEYFSSDVGRQRFAREIERARGRKIYTMALVEQLGFALKNARSAGFVVGRVRKLSLPYFSHRTRFHTVLLIELTPPAQTEGAGAIR
jgi:hypothetical protein